MQVEIVPGTHVRLGATVQFRITSAKDGFLVLLDVNAKNELVQIFPNQFSDRTGTQNRVSAKRPVLIPDASYGFRFQAQEPVGQGLLLAIVTEDALDLRSLLAPNTGLEAIPQAEDYLTKLAAYLRQTWHKDEFNRRVEWSLGKQAYTIIR